MSIFAPTKIALGFRYVLNGMAFDTFYPHFADSNKIQETKLSIGLF